MEVRAMRKIKEILFSENGMKVVNTLFFLAMLFYWSGLLFVAYIVWICYLVFCIRNTESRGSKVVYSVFVGLAVVMIGVSLYGLIRGFTATDASSARSSLFVSVSSCAESAGAIVVISGIVF